MTEGVDPHLRGCGQDGIPVLVDIATEEPGTYGTGVNHTPTLQEKKIWLRQWRNLFRKQFANSPAIL